MKKSSALALAIAGTLAAPIAMAESGFYASARVGIQKISSDVDADENLTFGDLNSRIGWRGETDLGNGLTAFGRLETSLFDDGDRSFGQRHLYAGLKGDFGRVNIAEQGYTTYYNLVSAPVDMPYFVGGNGILYNSRTNNFIDYQGGSDMFSFGVAVEANGTDTTAAGGNNTSTSGYQAAASVALGDNWNIGLGLRNAEDSDIQPTNKDVVGGTVSGTLGNFYIAGTMQQDDIQTGLQLHAAFGNFFLNYGQRDIDATTTSPSITPTEVAIGWAQSIGENTTLWAEAAQIDGDVADSKSTELFAALRYDWN